MEEESNLEAMEVELIKKRSHSISRKKRCFGGRVVIVHLSSSR